MKESTEQVTTSVSVDKDGLTRLTETRREQREPGGGHHLEVRTSRPIRDDETCEEAAAESMAFSDKAVGETLPMFIIFGGLLRGVRGYFRTLEDGSTHYVSTGRPDWVGGGEPRERGIRILGNEPPDEPVEHERGRELAQWRQKEKRLTQRRRRGRREEAE